MKISQYISFIMLSLAIGFAGLLAYSALVGTYPLEPPKHNSHPEVVSPADLRLPARMSDCGPKSLYAVLVKSGVGRSLRYSSIKEKFQFDSSGAGKTSALRIVEVARELGCTADAAKITYVNLLRWMEREGHYAILFCGEKHFAPVLSTKDNALVLCDPSVGVEIADESTLSGSRYRWTDVAILLTIASEKN